MTGHSIWGPRRCEAVRRYLVDVWRIENTRIELRPPLYTPDYHRPQHPLVAIEAQRVEIRSPDWEIVGPLMQVDIRQVDTLMPGVVSERLVNKPVEAADLTIAQLILYKYDSPELGPLNLRIVKEHLGPIIATGDSIVIVGQTDVVGLDDRNLKLSIDRATFTTDAIRKASRRAKPMIEHRGIGESWLFDNMLPEGRELNRTVIVMVWRRRI
jgi:outer membrane protein OmpA-like peptidoglycan-associated protein